MLNVKLVEGEETERYQAFRYQRMADFARAVAQTKEGKRLLGWLMLEAGGLLQVGTSEGRREMASAIYHLLDSVEPGLAEKIFLAERKHLENDNLNIATAIKNRSEEDAT
jgi:hypothetical protein